MSKKPPHRSLVAFPSRSTPDNEIESTLLDSIRVVRRIRYQEEETLMDEEDTLP